MIYWGLMLFGLGCLALVDFSMTGGQIFGPINPVIYLSISFAIFVRIRRKQKDAQLEKLNAENAELKKQLGLQPGTSKPQREMQETTA